MSTRWPSSASDAPTLIVVVVLPTPPFWLATAITRGSGYRPRWTLGTSSSGGPTAVGPAGSTGSAITGVGSSSDAGEGGGGNAASVTTDECRRTTVRARGWTRGARFHVELVVPCVSRPRRQWGYSSADCLLARIGRTVSLRHAPRGTRCNTATFGELERR